MAPGAGDGAVDEERRQRLRQLGVEDPRAVVLADDQRAAGVDQQRGVPGRQEARRSGDVAGQRRSREVEQLGAVLGGEAAQLEPGEVDLGRAEAGEARDLAPRWQARSPAGRSAPAARDPPSAGRPSPRRGRTGPRGGAPRCPTAGRGPCRATARGRGMPPCRPAPRARRAASARPPARGAPSPPPRPCRSCAWLPAATTRGGLREWRARAASSRNGRRGGWSSASASPGSARAARGHA